MFNFFQYRDIWKRLRYGQEIFRRTLAIRERIHKGLNRKRGIRGDYHGRCELSNRDPGLPTFRQSVTTQEWERKPPMLLGARGLFSKCALCAHCHPVILRNDALDIAA